MNSIEVEEVCDLFANNPSPLVEKDEYGALGEWHLIMDEEGELAIAYKRRGGGEPEFWYNRRTLSWSLGEWYGQPDEQEARRFAELLTRIYDGHEVVYDGSNWVGRLDDDAQTANEELESSLANFSAANHERCEMLWDLYDWFQGGEIEDMARRVAAGETTVSQAVADAPTYEEGIGGIDEDELRAAIEESVAELVGGEVPA